MKKARVIFLAVLAASSLGMMGAAGGCGSALHKASLAADSIGSLLNTAADVNHQAIASGAESTAEGMEVATLIEEAARANDAFVAQLTAAEGSGGKISGAAIISAFSTLQANVEKLQAEGVLKLKSASAQQDFAVTMNGISTEIAILKALVPSSGTSSIPKKYTPLLGLALTAEEISALIALATTAFGEGAALVEKLIAMKGEADTALLADAASQDSAAEKQAAADGATS